MGLVGSLRENLNFFVSLGIAEIFGFSELSVYTEVVLLKTFPQHLHYAPTANIKEVMKFCNLGDKTFETDFNLYRNYISENSILMKFLVIFARYTLAFTAGLKCYEK